MNITEEQISLLMNHLNMLFDETEHDAISFSRRIPTDDLEELWELRRELHDAVGEN